jgi:hypothetical protein
MLKIINAPVTDKLLKIYFLKLYQIGFLKCLDFRQDIFDSIIRSKSFDEINSYELVRCCPLAFADFIPEFLYYLGDDMIELETTVFDFPVLYTSIEKLGNTPFYEARYALFTQTGCDLYNEEGSMLKSIQPKSLYIDVNENLSGKYQIYIDEDKQLLIVDEYMINRANTMREIYRIEDVSMVNIIEMSDISIIIDAIMKHGFLLEYASEKFQDNKEVVLAAVLTNGSSLQFASENLRDDLEVVLAAVKNFGPALLYASNAIQLNKDVHDIFIEYFELKIEIINQLENAGRIYSDDVFWADIYQKYDVLYKEIVFLFIVNPGIHLKEDQDFIKRIFVILSKCNSDPDVIFRIAANKLLESKDFLIEILVDDRFDLFSFSFFTWSKFPSSFWSDADCVLAALKHDFSADSFNYASKELKSDREFVLKAVDIMGSALEHVSPELKADKEIVLIAIKNNRRAYEFASADLQLDREIVDLKDEDDDLDLPF